LDLHKFAFKLIISLPMKVEYCNDKVINTEIVIELLAENGVTLDMEEAIKVL